MNEKKVQELEAKGFKITTVTEFLSLTPEEERLIELRLTLSKSLKNRRIAARLSQEKFARLLHSSQSRVAKMESGDPSVSFDLLIRGLFASGMGVQDLGAVLQADDSSTA